MTFVKPSEIQVGRTYRAVKPQSTGMFSALFNDRTVIWLSHDRQLVQYDGPAVHDGRRYPKVTMAQFCQWALRDVTDELPPGEWQNMTYDTLKAEAQKRKVLKKALQQSSVATKEVTTA